MTSTLHLGDCRAVMGSLPACSVDAIVTDPPYELGFMSRKWDSSGIAYDVEVWRQALRVLKPGGHLIAFGGTRTYHRMACAIEDAGFEIRDCVQWWYATGFPKSLDVSKAIDAHLGATREVVGTRDVSRIMSGSGDMVGGIVRSGTVTVTAAATAAVGLGTALKPAVEPAVLARKPLGGTVAECVMAHGTGALNIDGCRIGWASEEDKAAEAAAAQRVSHTSWSEQSPSTFTRSGDLDASVNRYVASSQQGRWPANLIVDEHVAAVLDAQYGASRFFYVPKPDGTERDAGLDDMPRATGGEATGRKDGSAGLNSPRAGACAGGGRRNTHPTVKPIDLMRYLCRLVTPRGGVVLDPFVGSGTTGCAAALEGFGFVGIDLEPQHIEIARRRIAWWSARSLAPQTTARGALQPQEDVRQLTLLKG